MKKLLILFTLGCMISKAYSTPKNHNQTADSVECLKVLGIAVDGNSKPIDGVEVRLYKENEEMDWSEISNVSYHEHSFMYKLEANSYYTIEISKKGFVTRSIGINTNIPSTVSLDRIFQYEFEVTMFQEKKETDDYYLDFPVALISYDSSKEVFINNTAYTNHIKKMIQRSTNYQCNRSTQSQK